MKEPNETSIVEIDEDNLDKECIRLPSDYLKAAYNSINARREQDEAKRQMDVVEADLSRRIRDTPGQFGLEKVTDKACEACITSHAKYQEAVKNHNEACHKAALAQALVWAMDHKKRALTLLVELHGMSYFSEPKVSERGREAVESMTKKKVRRFRDDE